MFLSSSSLRLFGTALLFPLAMVTLQAQQQPVISSEKVAEILAYLSSDEMAGRATFSPQLDKAAAYIAERFKKAGLTTMPNENDYLQSFAMVRSKAATINEVTVGEDKLMADQVICQTGASTLKINQASGYEIMRVKEGENAMVAYRSIRGKKGNLVVLMHASLEPFFKRLKANSQARNDDGSTVIYLLTNQTEAENFNIDLAVDVEKLPLHNVVGVIPGKTKPNEYVIFSGHYDHIGIGKANEAGDSIYNGANDDASGTTAVIMLAEYFAKKNDNDRTLVFAAFTAEEVGGFGSQYFSKQMDPAAVMAMFNIEMIGTDSKWGTNSAYVTGYEKTDMGTILEKNLEGSPFKFYPDPYPQQQLFYRSDNATLARLGVPAHTISTSKMDSEPHYHKASDEISTLDTKNMAAIIESIAVSSKSIIAGKDTPTRVDTSQLR